VKTNRAPLRRLLVSVCLALLTAPLGWGQITNVTNDQATPTPGVGHDYVKMLGETVNPANGSVSLRINVPMPKGRQLSLPFAFAYDSGGVHHMVAFGTHGVASWVSNLTYLSQGGWSYGVPEVSLALGSRTSAPNTIFCGISNPCTCYYYSDYVFQQPGGGWHALNISSAQSTAGNPQCAYVVPGPPSTSYTSGGDGFYNASTSNLGSNSNFPPQPVTVADNDGTVFYFPMPTDANNSELPSWIEDRNGNQITVTDSGGGAFTFTDTLAARGENRFR
jgi:hypothetical protein